MKSASRSEKMRARWADPEYKARVGKSISERQRARSEDMSRITKELWQDPEYREKHPFCGPAYNKTPSEKLLHFICQACNKEFTDRPCNKNRKMCSRECYARYRTGRPNLKNRCKTPSHRCGYGIHNMYRGLRLRSLYELSFVRNYLEPQGLQFSYESIRLRWIDDDGTKRWFVPDFIVESQLTIFEIKYKKAADRMNEKLQQCFQLAAEAGFQYRVMTEHDFSILTYDEIAQLVVDGEVALQKRKNPGVQYKKLLAKIEKHEYNKL